jgi:DNA-binding IclR family transcriptional regulator
MASANLDSLCKGLDVLEITSRLGSVRGATLVRAKGWTRAQASRYLSTLAEHGWLKNVGTEKRPTFILGHKAVNLVPEARL